MRIFARLFAIAAIIAIGSCKEKEPAFNPNNTQPVIDSLTTSIVMLPFNNNKPAILNCYASGGQLNYTWDVDLGDLFVINDSGSQAQYSASACCMGDKIISCTVSNNKGEVMETITVTITE